MSVVTENPETLNTGIVIQAAPPHRFAGSLWIVEQVRTWGVQAYSVIPGQEGLAYVRLEWDQFKIVGPAPYRLGPTIVAKEEQPEPP